MDVASLRHPKEKSYYAIAATISAILHVCTVGLFYLIALLFAIPLWISEQLFKSQVFGHAVKVSDKQFPEIHGFVKKQMNELNLKKEVQVFVYNGQGLINAFAIKFLSQKYVILMSNLVDLMLKREAYPELEMIVGHELAHHALRHTSVMRNLFLMPSRFIPFLGLAYSRGCEYSADRVGFELTKSNKSAIRGLLSITLGSESLANATNIHAFAEQEQSVPDFFGLLSNMLSTHPRMTKRIKELLPLWESIPEARPIKPQPVFQDDSKYLPK